MRGPPKVKTSKNRPRARVILAIGALILLSWTYLTIRTMRWANIQNSVMNCYKGHFSDQKQKCDQAELDGDLADLDQSYGPPTDVEVLSFHMNAFLNDWTIEIGSRRRGINYRERVTLSGGLSRAMLDNSNSI
jgi:hypothetical protein